MLNPTEAVLLDRTKWAISERILALFQNLKLIAAENVSPRNGGWTPQRCSILIVLMPIIIFMICRVNLAVRNTGEQ
jgi:hypothetical protein